jgi:hypothetical protein
MEDFLNNKRFADSRRSFLKKSSLGFGSIALSALINPSIISGQRAFKNDYSNIDKSPHFIPKAKRVIYLFQSGGPSQIETFDFKPELLNWHGKEIPPSLKKNPKEFWNG